MNIDYRIFLTRIEHSSSQVGHVAAFKRVHFGVASSICIYGSDKRSDIDKLSITARKPCPPKSSQLAH